MPMPKLFGREPALWIGSLAAILSLAVGLGLPGLTDGLVTAIVAFLTAGAATWTAWHTTPVLPTVFSGLISTGAVLLGAVGLNLTQTQVSLTAAAAVALMGLVARAQITPVTDARSQLKL